MTRTRVFYGHQGVVPPTGSRPRSAARAVPEESLGEADLIGDEIVTPDGEVFEVDTSEDEVETADTPDETWKVADLDAYAELHGIDFGDASKKKDKLAVILGHINEGE
jgi:hypothetical protein